MNPFFDIRTISFFSGISAFAMCLCMLHVALRRKTYPGFYHWTAAAMCFGLGFVLFSLRGHLPEVLTIILANTLIFGSVILICRGLVLFCALRQMNRLDFSILAGFVLCFLYLTYGRSSVNGRIVVTSALGFFFLVRATWLAGWPVAEYLRERNWILVAALSVSALWLILRGGVALLGHRPIVDFMAAGYFQGLSFIVFTVSNLLGAVGLISINSNRLENDLAAAMSEIKTLRGIIPICSSCKKIRDDQGYWQQVEHYFQSHAEVEFSHSFCPECVQALYPFLRRK